VGSSHQRQSISQPEGTSPSYLHPPDGGCRNQPRRKREDSCGPTSAQAGGQRSVMPRRNKAARLRDQFFPPQLRASV
jgi:hypothetical protein